jgi:hypothetical protein
MGYSLRPKPQSKILVIRSLLLNTLFLIRTNNNNKIKGLNSIYTHVLYDLYFLPHQFHFLSNLIPVVYEKTKMVPPSDFPSKTNVQPRHFLGGLQNYSLTLKIKNHNFFFTIDTPVVL